MTSLEITFEGKDYAEEFLQTNVIPNVGDVIRLSGNFKHGNYLVKDKRILYNLSYNEYKTETYVQIIVGEMK